MAGRERLKGIQHILSTVESCALVDKQGCKCFTTLIVCKTPFVRREDAGREDSRQSTGRMQFSNS
jgi:hypothetical protein